MFTLHSAFFVLHLCREMDTNLGSCGAKLNCNIMPLFKEAVAFTSCIPFASLLTSLYQHRSYDYWLPNPSCSPAWVSVWLPFHHRVPYSTAKISDNVNQLFLPNPWLTNILSETLLWFVVENISNWMLGEKHGRGFMLRLYPPRNIQCITTRTSSDRVVLKKKKRKKKNCLYSYFSIPFSTGAGSSWENLRRYLSHHASARFQKNNTSLSFFLLLLNHNL